MSFEIDAQLIADTAVGLLAREVVLPATVLAVAQSNYVGSGGTVRVVIPQRRTARVQGSAGGAITFDNIDEDAVQVVVQHLYNGTNLTDEALTLDIRELSRQVLAPMAVAVAEGAEEVLAAEMNDVVEVRGFTDLTDPEDVRDDVLAIREALTTQLVPAGGRWLAVSPSVATAILRVKDFVKVNESGGESALRDATIGRVFGMTVVESAALAEASMVGYHTSGFGFATLSPAIPNGAPYAAVSIEKGIAVRTVMAFDTGHLQDAVALSTFAGSALLDDARVVKIADVAS